MRPSITVKHAELKTLVAKSPVPVTIYLDQVVMVGPNKDPKRVGKTVIKCDTVDCLIDDELEAVIELITTADTNKTFVNLTSAQLGIKIPVRKNSIIGHFISPTADMTNLYTIVGPIPVNEKPETIFS